MRRTLLFLLPLGLAVPGALRAQSDGADRAALIRSALSAAPPSLAERATVVDHGDRVLREGTNGWVCIPDMPDLPNDSPMCLDAPWREVISAWMNKRPPKAAGLGIGYMLQGDLPVSNIDPFATKPAPGNQWLQEGVPHIMLFLADQSPLEGMSTDPKNGGPWVMWKGTPYAHVMIPTVRRTN
ncbi:MAG TPA: hypothetical protein VFQ38_11970 [Longimicrobiales bacterium]|nr:hypothetical protein [Longimicrobiales bacterium]